LHHLPIGMGTHHDANHNRGGSSGSDCSGIRDCHMSLAMRTMPSMVVVLSSRSLTLMGLIVIQLAGYFQLFAIVVKDAFERVGHIDLR